MTVYANRSNETVLSAAMQIIILLCLQNSMGVQDEKVLCFVLILVFRRGIRTGLNE